MITMRKPAPLLLITPLLIVLLLAMPAPAFAQAPKPGVEGYQVEWMYRVKYGFIDEWWDIFRKYEVPVLERAKQLGTLITDLPAHAALRDRPLGLPRRDHLP
jgi:hypothetical protein